MKKKRAIGIGLLKMKTLEISRTAIITAAMRASHMILDASPHVLEDRFALQFSGFETDKALIDFFSDFKPMRFTKNKAYFSKIVLTILLYLVIHNSS